MAKVVPFKGILPEKKLAEKIVTKSADNYSVDEARKIFEKNNLTYLSVIYPDFVDNERTKPHSLERFKKIYNRFLWFKENRYFVQEHQPTYYIYKQKHADFEFNGIIAAISTEDYFNGNIKIHEQTLTDREKKLKEYLKHCKINAEPVLFFYPDNSEITSCISAIQTHSPDVTVNIEGIQHSVWKSLDEKKNSLIQKYFDEMGSVFIADGHHRSASSSLLAKELSNNINAQYFLGAFFPESNLKIFSFHRLLKNVQMPDNFLEKIAEYFEVKEIYSTDYSLENNVLGMYNGEKRYLLKYRGINTHALDTEILNEYIFKKIFLLNDIRNNNSVNYYSEYTCSIEQAEKMVDEKKYQIAFFTYPVSVQDIKNIALQGKTMPPKSTYVLPKLLNALIIYSLENGISG